MIPLKVFASVLILLALFAPTTFSEHLDTDGNCNLIHEIDDPDEQCWYIQNDEDCAIDEGYLNYSEAIYCTFQGTGLKVLGYILFALWFLYLLLCMAVTSDRVFIPNLAAIAKALHFSENVAGETLLPLGNGAPDIFTSLAAALSMKGGDVSILYGTLLGSGTFTTTVIVASVIMIKPFRTMERPLLRVMIFYMCAVFTAFAVAWDGEITIMDSIIFLILYVIYLASVLIGTRVNMYLLEKAKRKRSAQEAEQAKSAGNEGGETVVGHVVPGDFNLPAITVSDAAAVEEDNTPQIVVEDTESPRPPSGIIEDDSYNPSRKTKHQENLEKFRESVGGDRLRISRTLSSHPPELATKSTIGSALELPQGRPKAVSLSEANAKGAMEAAAAAVRNSTAMRARSHSAPRRGSRDSGRRDRGVSNASQMSRIAKMMVQQGEYIRETNRSLRAASQTSSVHKPGSKPSSIAGSKTQLYNKQISKTSSVHSRGRDDANISNLEAFLMPEPPSSSSDESDYEQDNGHVRLNVQYGTTTPPPSINTEHLPSAEQPPRPFLTVPTAVPEVATEEETIEEEELKDKPVWRWLLDGLNPIEMDEWKTGSWFSKIMQVLKSPILFLIFLTNPVLDDEKPQTNWNRPLNALHCLTTPVYIMFALKSLNNMIGDTYPTVAVVAAAGIGLGVFIFLTNTNLKRPCYHIMFAVAGFIATAMWIYLFANEVVNLIKCFGLSLNLSQSILCITFLAWGNSLGDFINDTTVARQGYSKMAISACYASTNFNVLLGLGLPLLIITISNGGSLPVVLPDILMIMFGFLSCSLVSSFIAIPLIQRFYVRRPYGIYLFLIYAACLTCIILVEAKVIHLKMAV